MRAGSTLALCRDLTVNTHGIRTFFKDGTPSIALALGMRSVFAYSALITDFKGVPMKLKIVGTGSPCNFRGIASFYDFSLCLTVKL